MKYIITTILLLTIISCKKNKPNDPILAGDTVNSDLIVSNHNLTTQGIFIDYYSNNEGHFSIDLNDDGYNDVSFFSKVDSIYNSTMPEINHSYKIELRNNNSNFSFAEVPNSHYFFENQYPYEIAYDGTFPRKTTPIVRSCDSIINATKIIFNPHVNHLTLNESINSSLNWQVSPTLSLYNSMYEYAYYETGAYGDSLIGYRITNDITCHSVPKNEIFFIPFRELREEKYIYGWIEAKIEDQGRITVVLSAIQKK